MATTYTGSLPIRKQSRSEPGFARRLFDRYVEARQEEANRRITGYLQSLDAGTLAQLGYTNAQIKRLHNPQKAA